MKKRFLSVILWMSIPIFLSAQTGDPAKYAALITGNLLQQHLTIVAGDEMEGRETGTEGQRKAAAYIETQFKNIGLLSADTLKGYQQFYPLYKDSMISSDLSIAKRKLQYGSDYFVPVLNNESKNLSAKKIIFIGYGIDEKNYSDYTGKNVTGKIVVFFLGEPKANGNYLVSGTSKMSKYSFPGIQTKLMIAKQKGAAGAIVINQSMETLSNQAVASNRQSKIYFYENKNITLNYVILSHAAAKDVFNKWKIDSLISKVKANLPLQNEKVPEINKPVAFNYKKQKQQINASNIIGIIEGTDKKDEYLFLTAHYDHLGKQDGAIYYGADDDGSGTCAVIAMANAFAKAKAEGNGPRRTIVFMTVSGEEKGLWGSEYYTDHPVFSLAKTTADLNTDMVGRIDRQRKVGDSTNYIYVIGHDKLSTDLPVINEGVNKKYTNLEFDYKFDDPNDPEKIYYRSDHYNFARKGVPVLFFYDGMLDEDYHKPTDTVDKINWELYQKRVRMIFHTAWEMANRDEMLKRDLPLPEEGR